MTLFLRHTGALIQTTAQSWPTFQLTDSPFYLGFERTVSRLGTPWPVAGCGVLTVASVAYTALIRPSLRRGR